jgi:thiamine transporter ThiT
MPVRSDLSFTDSFTGNQRRKFYEGHRSIAMLMIAIVFLSPFAGLYVTGLFGAVLGLLLSVVGYYLTPYVWLKVGG